MVAAQDRQSQLSKQLTAQAALMKLSYGGQNL
jgi:hypothetical protein